MNSPEYNNGEIEDVDSDEVDGGGQAFKGKGDIFIQGDGAGSLGVDLQKEFGRKIKVMGEEVELDEGRMKELMLTIHDKLEKEGGAAGFADLKKAAKAMGVDLTPDMLKKMPKVRQHKDGDYILENLKEASARADAMRAMRRDREVDPADVDDSATDDDRKAASKNIMMQMRKAQSLKGRFDVEFQDGKKMKVPTKIAMAVQQKYNSFRKPADKEKFQAQVGKSYKDMLAALKEGFASDAQRRAAFASGYKEKGKKKKESTLERMNKKIQEKKNG